VFFGPQRLRREHAEDRPMFQVDAHVTRDLAEHLWTAFDVAWYTGGQASVDGVAARSSTTSA